ncbi:MAG: T9SS type A sorting domain-containing protein [Bacteroidota bacterium]
MVDEGFADTDNDGVCDVVDECPNNPQLSKQNACGCQEPDSILVSNDTALLIFAPTILVDAVLLGDKQTELQATESVTLQAPFSFTPTGEGNLSVSIDTVAPILTDTHLVIVADTNVICKGEQVKLSARGNFDDFEWNYGGVNPEILVTPTQPRTYEVVASTNSGCQRRATLALQLDDSGNCPTCLGTANQLRPNLCNTATQSLRFEQTHYEYYEIVADGNITDLHPFDLMEGQQKIERQRIEQYYNPTDKFTQVISYLNPEEMVDSWMDQPATMVMDMDGTTLYGCDGTMMNSIPYEAENKTFLDDFYSQADIDIVREDTFTIINDSMRQVLVNQGYTLTNTANGFTLTNDSVEVSYDTLANIISLQQYDATNLLINESHQQWAAVNGITYLATQIEKQYKILRNGTCVRVVRAKEVRAFEPNFCQLMTVRNTERPPVEKRFTTSNNFSVFPNPTSDILQFEMPPTVRGQLVEVLILNTLGQAVLATSLKDNVEARISVANLAKGTYLIRLETADEFYTTKFVKQ